MCVMFSSSIKRREKELLFLVFFLFYAATVTAPLIHWIGMHVEFCITKCVFKCVAEVSIDFYSSWACLIGKITGFFSMIRNLTRMFYVHYWMWKGKNDQLRCKFMTKFYKFSLNSYMFRRLNFSPFYYFSFVLFFCCFRNRNRSLTSHTFISFKFPICKRINWYQRILLTAIGPLVWRIHFQHLDLFIYLRRLHHRYMFMRISVFCF